MKHRSRADKTLSGMRKEYRWGSLDKKDLDRDPVRQFARWFGEAADEKSAPANAMMLATASRKGKPSARMMLLKSFDREGFVFYTHYESVKAKDLGANPHAAIVFYWPEKERQVRIEGRVKKISRRESERYFYSRPRDAQIAAWTSAQSRPIDSRATLDMKFRVLKNRYKESTVPCPPFWGGYVLKPVAIEFWQGRENRLNDRFRYRKATRSRWTKERLEP